MAIERKNPQAGSNVFSGAANPAGQGTSAPVGDGAPKSDVEVMDVSKVRSAEDMSTLGGQLYETLSDEEKALIGSKRGTLHYVRALGRQSKTSSRMDSTTQKNVASLHLDAVVLKSDEDILVPQIPLLPGKERLKLGIREGDVTYELKKAGEEFILTTYEVMQLFMQYEFFGACEADGAEDGLRLTVRVANMFSGDAKLPTPYLSLANRPIKAEIHPIDRKNENDQWEVLPEYAEKFGILFQRRSAGRTSANSRGSKKASASVKSMLALRTMLNFQQPAAPAAPSAAAKKDEKQKPKA